MFYDLGLVHRRTGHNGTKVSYEKSLPHVTFKFVCREKDKGRSFLFNSEDVRRQTIRRKSSRVKQRTNFKISIA